MAGLVVGVGEEHFQYPAPFSGAETGTAEPRPIPPVPLPKEAL